MLAVVGGIVTMSCALEAQGAANPSDTIVSRSSVLHIPTESDSTSRLYASGTMSVRGRTFNVLAERPTLVHRQLKHRISQSVEQGDGRSQNTGAPKM